MAKRSRSRYARVTPLPREVAALMVRAHRGDVSVMADRRLQREMRRSVKWLRQVAKAAPEGMADAAHRIGLHPQALEWVMRGARERMAPEAVATLNKAAEGGREDGLGRVRRDALPPGLLDVCLVAQVWCLMLWRAIEATGRGHLVVRVGEAFDAEVDALMRERDGLTREEADRLVGSAPSPHLVAVSTDAMRGIEAGSAALAPRGRP